MTRETLWCLAAIAVALALDLAACEDAAPVAWSPGPTTDDLRTPAGDRADYRAGAWWGPRGVLLHAPEEDADPTDGFRVCGRDGCLWYRE